MDCPQKVRHFLGAFFILKYNFLYLVIFLKSRFAKKV